jgi:predicted enzyme related to lactoylglutathione lyase
VTSKFTELVVDCRDPVALADFWAAVLGWEKREVTDEGEVEVEVFDPAGSSPALLFQTVPEGKSVKNRLHMDVNPVGVTQAQELERLLALGATHVDIGQGDQTWYVLADPEGNEFCLLRTTVD